jgi:hypothetical protein
MALNTSILNHQVLPITLFKPIFGACMVCLVPHTLFPQPTILTKYLLIIHVTQVSPWQGYH